MTSELVELFKWNAWANNRYRIVFKKMPLQDLNIETPYGNLLDRIVHIFGSFDMWLKRINGQSPQSVIKSSDFPSWEDLEKKWIEFDQKLVDFVSTITSEKLQQEVTYTSLDGAVYTRKIQHVLLHLTAHPNYHRGHISAIFKLKNLPRLPATDMVVYFLEN